ncbi:hypothetical protein chiPu_0026917, partial [Chiloscyllium punctatum]|nr:hypothetical protein [Chiloscyllium punctatum]
YGQPIGSCRSCTRSLLAHAHAPERQHRACAAAGLTTTPRGANPTLRLRRSRPDDNPTLRLRRSRTPVPTLRLRRLRRPRQGRWRIPAPASLLLTGPKRTIWVRSITTSSSGSISSRLILRHGVRNWGRGNKGSRTGRASPPDGWLCHHHGDGQSEL